MERFLVLELGVKSAANLCAAQLGAGGLRDLIFGYHSKCASDGCLSGCWSGRKSVPKCAIVAVRRAGGNRAWAAAAAKPVLAAESRSDFVDVSGRCIWPMYWKVFAIPEMVLAGASSCVQAKTSCP
jgi:hypothetical protein